MNELTRKPARTVPNWQAPPTSTGLKVRPAIEESRGGGHRISNEPFVLSGFAAGYNVAASGFIQAPLGP